MVKIKVERLIHPTEWVQKSKIGDIKVANVSFEDEHSVRNVISKYNRFQGRRTGKFIHVTYNTPIRDKQFFFFLKKVSIKA